MTEPTNVAKHGITVTLSAGLLAGMNRGASGLLASLPAAADRLLNATPEQRAEWRRRSEFREAEVARQRATERAEADVVPLTVDALLAKMGWSREYAEHLVQPYCECGDDIDGWSYCQHARDLGLAP